jgi:dihydrofolate reductase
MPGAEGGAEAGSSGVDDGFVARGFEGIGAWIIGRNMFGPVRGPWPDESWKGWWGDTPPYHVPVFVLTHYAREPVEMQGGTTFHFVTDGIHAALGRAMEAAGGRDVRLGGGVSTMRGYLAAGLVDEMHTVVSPVLLGRGERLWDGLDLAGAGYECGGSVAGEGATHYFIRKTPLLR